MDGNMDEMMEGESHENKIYLGDEFAEAPDGEEIEVTVSGTKQTVDGKPCLQVTAVDGVPVGETSPADMEPGKEMVGRMKDAGYLKGSQELE